jgi:hypothetical protein
VRHVDLARGCTTGGAEPAHISWWHFWAGRRRCAHASWHVYPPACLSTSSLTRALTVVYAAEPDWLRDHGANAAASAARDAALARAARRERIRKAALSVPNTGDVFAVRCPAYSRPSTQTDSSHMFVGDRLRAPGRLHQQDRPAPAELLV